MYFNHEAQAKIVHRFHFALREGGYLVLGKAEMLLNFVGAFTPEDLKQRVFTKVRVDNAAERLLSGYPEPEERTLLTGPPARLREISFDQDPIAQFAVDVKSRLLLANARARELFGLTARDLGRPHVREVAWPSIGGEPRYFNVQVTPIVDSADAPLGAKVIFTDVTRQARTAGRAPAVAAGARDGVRRAAVHQRGARNDERRTAVDCRRARDDQRGASIDQRGAGDDERRAPVDQRGAGNA